MWLILSESDILSDHADGLGSDVQERGEVLQGKMLNNAGTTLQQPLVALAGCGDEAKPSCGVTFALHLVALTVSYLLALALAKLAQRLDVNTVFSEFLFHRQWLFGCKVTKSFRDKSRGFGIKRVMREKRWPKIKLIAEFCRDSS